MFFLPVLKPPTLRRHGLVGLRFRPRRNRRLASAIGLGGHVRARFETSLWNADGGIARDNAESSAERPLASAHQAGVILGMAFTLPSR
jgi:hypothetical protein